VSGRGQAPNRATPSDLLARESPGGRLAANREGSPGRSRPSGLAAGGVGARSRTRQGCPLFACSRPFLASHADFRRSIVVFAGKS
jgi:hypothetical protein